jgi:oligopeptidase B
MSHRPPTDRSAVAAPAAAPVAPPDAPTLELAPDPGPPRAPRVPWVEVLHGEERQDDFRWLRDRTNPDTIAYLEAENRYTERATAPTAELREALYREMVGRIQETDLSVPEWYDGYFYYVRVEQGQQYPIHCRRRGSMEAAEEVILDQNTLAAGHDYFRVGAVEPSPDGRLLAYSTDTSGAEEFTLVIKNLATGELLPESIPGTSYGVEWAADSRTLFYTLLDTTRRPDRLMRHRAGTNPAEDVLVYHEPDCAFFLGIGKTKSQAYLILELGSHTTTEERFLRADDPAGEFRLVRPRIPGVEYDVVHHGDRFFIVTNDGAENFRLMEAPVSAPERANWREVLPYDPAVKLDGAEAFRHHLVLYERVEGLQRMRIMDLRTGAIHAVRFPEPVYTIRRSGNPDFDSSVVRFGYTSLVTPASVIDYHMDERSWELRKRTEVHGYDASLYRSDRLLACAPDGVRVPVSLVWREPLVKDGSRPALLLGYGAYGSSYDPAFSSNYVSLLDRGFIVAIAHVRGGEELGRRWYDDGRLLRKRNTFSDFVAAAEHLIAERYTAADRLAISGGSAGGLLVGAVLNARPDLFHAAVADVPFVDVVNTMMDASLPLTVIEYDEWGNPAEREYYDYIRSYSPYDNVAAQRYPHLLVTAGLNDPRVAYWEPAKWVARLRATKTDVNRLLLKTHMGAGHAGASGRYDYLREVAFKYAFLLDVMPRPLPAPPRAP